jgi:hypothetical protein
MRHAVLGSRALTRAILAAALLAVWPAAVSAAETKTFGADLSRPANNTTACSDPVPYAIIAPGAASCTWWGIGSVSDSSESHVVPYPGGTVKRVRVKTGPVTGRMQVVVIGLIRSNASTASPGCCFFRRASQVFTPAPNAITEVPVELPVKHELNALSNAWDYDTLALSVLDPGVPVPAHRTGATPTGLGIASGALYPGFDASAPERTSPYSLPEYQVLLQADIDLAERPDDAAAPQPGAPQVKPVAPRIVRAVPSRRGVRTQLQCPPGAVCVGDAVLVADGAKLRAKQGKQVTLGRRAYRVEAGKTATVTVTLSRRGRRAVRRKSRVRAHLVLRDAARREIARRAVTLKVRR